MRPDVFSHMNNNGGWQGGREKAPAAFCRKAICSTKDFEMWGDGEQTRSFMFIDDCVEGTIRIMEGDYKLPLNLGTEEMASFAADLFFTVFHIIVVVVLERRGVNTGYGLRVRAGYMPDSGICRMTSTSTPMTTAFFNAKARALPIITAARGHECARPRAMTVLRR